MAQQVAPDAQQLQASRQRFLLQLPQRLEALDAALATLQQGGVEPKALDVLQKRLGAMADACELLQLEMLGTAFASVDSALASGALELTPAELQAARDTLQLAPTLIPTATSTAVAVPRQHVERPVEPVLPTGESHAPAQDSSPKRHRMVIRTTEQLEPTAATPQAQVPPPEQPKAITPPLTADAGARNERTVGNPDFLQGRTVLIADDDPAVVDFLARAVEGAGASAVRCHDGYQAWQLAQDNPPDLILSDVLMPHLDGFGLCQNLKRDVVLNHVPVILMAWKEDQLRRAKDLGAGADGYLTKNADERVIVERCSEPLKERAGLEKRLSEQSDLRGRLDGISSHMLLRLVAQHKRHASVTLKDADFEYAVCIAEGRIRTLDRFTLGPRNGSRSQGPSILPGLIGIRSARFAVHEDEVYLGNQFLGDVDELLKPHVMRIRRAAHQLQGNNLHAVHELKLDESALQPYLTTAPGVVARLLEKLSVGYSPTQLLASVSAGLLESVLLDIASRGMVLAAYDSAHNNLLETAPNCLPIPFDVEVRTPSSKPQAATEIESSNHTKPMPAAELVAPAEHSPATTEDANPTALLDLGEPFAGPGDAPNVPLEHQQLTSETTEKPAQQANPATTRHAPPKPTRRVESAPEPQVTADPQSAAQPQVAPEPQIAAEPQVAADPQIAAEASVDEPCEAEEAPLETQQKVLESNNNLEPNAHAEAREEAPTDDEPEERIALSASVEEPEPSRDLSEWVMHQLAATPRPAQPQSAQPADVTTPEETPAAKAKPRARTRANALGWARNHAQAILKQAKSVLDRLPKELDESPYADVIHHEEEAEEQEEALELTHKTPTPDVAETTTHDTEVAPISQDDEPSDASEAQCTSSESTAKPKGSKKAARAKRSFGKVKPLAQKAGKVAIPAAIIGGSALAAYVVMGGLAGKVELAKHDNKPPPTSAVASGDSFQVPPELLNNPADKPLVSIKPPGSEKQVTRSAPEMQSVRLAMPEGLNISGDKGLLEINSAGKHKLYVDGVFVGRGPVRRVPLKPGTHVVMLREGDSEDEFDVVIAVGERTRLQPLSRATK